MKEQNQMHVQEEQIVWAVIDVNELDEQDRAHLLACPVCSGRVEQFKADLQEFGDRAVQAVPPFSGTVKLPVDEKAAARHNDGWLPFFGATAMAGLVLFFYVMGGMGTMQVTRLAASQSQQMLLEDETLMQEISEMVEYPLSEDMYKITGEDGNGTDLDDDFMEFIVPDIEADFQS